jgi:GNAT superfamily N-acetyltransferase
MSERVAAVDSDAHLLTFEHQSEYNGGSRWPYDHMLTAMHPEHGPVGSLKYKMSGDRANSKIKIDRLEVDAEHRRKGYGSALMDAVQARHPKSSIDHGDRTDAREAWWADYGDGKADKRGRTAIMRRTTAIRMVPPEEYRKFHYPDYPQAKTPAALARHFKKTSPEYYSQIKSDAQKNGITTPMLVKWTDQRGNPLRKPQAMSGHHRAAVAHELGLHMPVGDYDNPADHDLVRQTEQAWFQENERPLHDRPGRYGRRIMAADDWQFSHHHLEGPHWRSFGGPAEDPRKVMTQYKLRDGGVQFESGSDHDYQVRKHGDGAVQRVQQAAREHHGVEDAPPPAAAPQPTRRAPRVYYHGTTAEDVTHVLPANRHGQGVTFNSDTSPEHAYASLDKGAAWHYAEMAHYVTGNKPRVYQVRPIGGDHSHVEQDPTWDDIRDQPRGNYQGDQRSKVGFEVVRELKTPRHIHDAFDWPEKDSKDDAGFRQARLATASGPLYHGTAIENLTHILPATKSGARPIYGETDPAYAYATHSPEDAWDYAKDAHAEAYHSNPRTTQIPRVYEVRPLGNDHSHIEADPAYLNGQQRDTNSGDRRSRAGFQVVRELPAPPDLHEHLDWLRGGAR